MRSHPARPASVYRPCGEAEDISWKVRQFIRAMKAPIHMMAPMWVEIYRAMARARLPRNFFTTAAPAKDEKGALDCD